MRFLADMGVDLRVVEWLRRHGHDAVHLRDEGRHRALDEQVFAKALAEDRIILTFDLDFGDLAALSGDRAARVILLRLENTRTAHVIERLEAVLAASSGGPGMTRTSTLAVGPGEHGTHVGPGRYRIVPQRERRDGERSGVWNDGG